MIYATAAQLTLGAILDLIIGDPRWLPHPVQGIGLLVRVLENAIRRISQGRLAGLVLVIIVIDVLSPDSWRLPCTGAASLSPCIGSSVVSRFAAWTIMHFRSSRH